MIKWVFEIYKADFANPYEINVENFIHNYLVFDAGIKDSVAYYDISRLQRRFPRVKTIDEALGWLENNIPTLARDRKFILYSQVFANRIANDLREYHERTKGLEPSIPIVVKDFYQEAFDFKIQPFTSIFVNPKDVNNWISNKLLISTQFFLIFENLDLSLALKIEPYLYRHTDGHIYLIQNVIGGDIDMALAVAKEWRDTHINTGPMTPPIDPNEDVKYFIYIIAPSGKISAIEDKTGGPDGPDGYLEILRYTEDEEGGRFGAILRLL